MDRTDPLELQTAEEPDLDDLEEQELRDDDYAEALQEDRERTARARGQLHDQRRSTIISLLVDGDTDPRTAAELVDSLCAVVPAPRVSPTITRTAAYDLRVGDPASYAAGLRVLADAVESGAVPRPSFGAMHVYLHGDDQRAQLRAAIQALGGGRWDKHGDDERMTLIGAVGGLPINLTVSRDQVCERVVVGREEVEVPAVPAIMQPAQPARTEVREVVRWDCGSLLSDVPAGVVPEAMGTAGDDR